MREGLGRKCGELIALIAFELLTVGLNLPKYIITGISVYIIFMELVSLLENLEKLGVPLPSFVHKALGVADDILDGKDEELSPETKAKIKEAIEKIKKEG
jgi:phage-related holin